MRDGATKGGRIETIMPLFLLTVSHSTLALPPSLPPSYLRLLLREKVSSQIKNATGFAHAAREAPNKHFLSLITVIAVTYSRRFDTSIPKCYRQGHMNFLPKR